MKLSLIVATYNSVDFLEMVLLSLQQQKLDASEYSVIEVVIADDGSTLETKNLLDKYSSHLPFKLIHVWHEDNGFRLAAIRNLAVRNSSGAYLVFLDCDCLLPPDFLDNQLKLREKGYCVAGNRVLLSQKYTEQIIRAHDINVVNNGNIKNIFYKITGKINKFFPGVRLNINAGWRKSRENDWKMPKGCNFALWREDYIRVNGFDESFTGWGHEDSDIVVRVLHAGILIKNGRFAVPVFHMWHKESSREQKNSNYARLMQRIVDPKFIRAEIGVSQE